MKKEERKGRDGLERESSGALESLPWIFSSFF